jgi:hypothetical protein
MLVQQIAEIEGGPMGRRDGQQHGKDIVVSNVSDKEGR